MSQKMRAVVIQEGQTTKVQEIPIPDELKENEVLLKVVAVGLSKGCPVLRLLGS